LERLLAYVPLVSLADNRLSFFHSWAPFFLDDDIPVTRFPLTNYFTFANNTVRTRPNCYSCSGRADAYSDANLLG